MTGDLAAAAEGCHIFSGCGYPAPGLQDFNFRKLFSIGGWNVTKPELIAVLCVIIIVAFFWTAFAKPRMIPGKAQSLGEMAVLDGGPRSADATANTDCAIFAIDRRDLIPFALSQPTLGMKIIALLCERIRWLSDRAEQLNRRDLPGRLANTLLGLTETCRFDAESRTIAITQQEVSEMVGMSRESVNKQLGAWALRKWVRLEHRAIVVLDASALRELAEGPD